MSTKTIWALTLLSVTAGKLVGYLLTGRLMSSLSNVLRVVSRGLGIFITRLPTWCPEV